MPNPQRKPIAEMIYSVLYSAEEQRIASLVKILNLVLMIASLLSAINSYFATWLDAFLVSLFNFFVYLLLYSHLRKKHLKSATLITVFLLWVSITYLIYDGDGIHDVGMMAFPIILAIGSMLFNRFYYVTLSLLCLCSVLIIGVGEYFGFVTNKYTHDFQWGDLFTTLLLFATASVLIRIMTEFSITAVQRANERERQYGEILNSLHDAVFIHDAVTGQVLDVNDTMLSMYGFKRGDINNFTVESLSANEEGFDAEAAGKRIQEAVQSGSANFKWKACKKDGSTFWVNVALKLTEVDGVNRVVAIVRDIDMQIQMEEQLKQAEKLTAIGQLAGGIAHDFNNMLAGIMGASEVMAMKERDGSDKEMLELIINSSQRASDLTSKLLSFSKKRHMVMERININEVIDEAVALLRRSIDKKINIKTELSDEHTRIVGDKTQLINVFLNLGINASDAIGDAGEIIIRSHHQELDEAYCKASSFKLEAGDYIDIRMIDNGSGIAPEIKEKIFDPFFSTKDKNKNTGLGLAAAYGILVEHHGSISVYSEEGKGTEFHMYIPLTEQKTDQQKQIPTVKRGSGNILLIDDEPAIVQSVTSMLVQLGYQVLSANNGKQGLDIYKEKHYDIDVVILDMLMPEMNGQECFYKLKEINPRVRVIVSSGFSEDISIQALMNDGAKFFINKPYRLLDLSEAIESCIASK